MKVCVYSIHYLRSYLAEPKLLFKLYNTDNTSSREVGLPVRGFLERARYRRFVLNLKSLFHCCRWARME